MNKEQIIRIKSEYSFSDIISDFPDAAGEL